MSGNHDDDGNLTRRRWLAVGAGAGVVALGVVWWPGCRRYPTVTSREALELMKLLYAACNTRDEKRLARAERELEALSVAGKLTPAERQSFEAILGQARAGQWQEAADAAFRFAQDQVSR